MMDSPKASRFVLGAVWIIITLICFGPERVASAQRKASPSTRTATPTSTDVKRRLEKDLNTDSSVLRVRSVRKTNGSANKLTGQYTIYFDIELVCIGRNATRGFPFLGQIACYEEGEVLRNSGSMAFHRTERGWRPIDESVHPSQWYKGRQVRIPPSAPSQTTSRISLIGTTWKLFYNGAEEYGTYTFLADGKIDGDETASWKLVGNKLTIKEEYADLDLVIAGNSMKGNGQIGMNPRPFQITGRKID